MKNILIVLVLLLLVGGGWQYFKLSSVTHSPPGDPIPMTRISGAQAQSLIESGGFLLDVRTPKEFSRGHPSVAVNHPVQVLGTRLDQIPKDRSIVVYCQSGIRSKKAMNLLKEAGYSQVFDLGSVNAYPSP